MVALYAGINGYLDDIPTDQVSRFQEELREYLRTEGDAPRGRSARRGTSSDETAAALDEAIEQFKGMFNVDRAR